MLKFMFFTCLLFHFTGVYEFTIKDINNNDLPLSSFKGKKILIVNIATESKYSDQLKSLDSLALKYEDSLVIVACPSNSFGHENKSDPEILDYINNNQTVHFLISEKMNLSTDTMEPLFDWLTHASKNGALDCMLNGDFYKFLIDSSGNLIGIFAPSVDPMSDELQSALIN